MMAGERNRRIAEMRRKGATYGDIGRAFGITSVRAYQVCKRMQRDEERKADPVCSLLLEADRQLGNTCGTYLVTRTQNVLRRKGVNDAAALSRVSLREVARMRNAGANTVALVAIAQEIARSMR